jgi:(p)ppGpp synthase/HD superfamily hydrolase
MSGQEHAMRLADRIRAVIESPSDRLDDLVKATGLNPRSDLRYGDWRGLDLSGADLRDFDFTGANLAGTRFDNALIEGAVFDQAIFEMDALSHAADFERAAPQHSPNKQAADARPRMMRQYDLTDLVRSYNPDTNEDLLNRAYVYGMKAHGTQTSSSGDLYFAHRLEVARILANLKLDDASIVAALLQETIEKTEATRSEIHQVFGPEIAGLVEGLTEPKQLELASREAKQADILRKLLLASAADVRVLMVKLADRLFAMRGVTQMEPGARREFAAQTLDIYAPLAGHLGMYAMQQELENLSFRTLDPEAYMVVTQRLDALAERNRNLIGDIESHLTLNLQNHGIAAHVYGRFKQPFSIWRKMERKSVGFEQLSDILAFRAVVSDLESCYRALGVIQTTWPVVPGRFKDYISTPKQNDYRSIHTTVVGPGNQRVELQICTEEMDQVAELGIAAQVSYKDSASSTAGIDKRESPVFTWLRRTVQELSEGGSSPEEFLEHAKLELFHDQVLCFTPKGKLIALPSRANALDFAYALHVDVGNSAVGCKINGKFAPLSSELQNGDEIEILTSQAQSAPPSAWEWLAVTGKARAAIRRATRTAAKTQHADRPVRNPSSIPVRSAGHNLPMQFASTGGAVPGDRIVGILLGDVITIYPIHSSTLIDFEEQPELWFDVQWDLDNTNQRFSTRIKVRCLNEPGNLTDVTAVIVEQGGAINNISVSRPSPDSAEFIIDVEVTDLAQLTAVITQLRAEPFIIDVERVSN